MNACISPGQAVHALVVQQLLCTAHGVLRGVAAGLQALLDEPLHELVAWEERNRHDEMAERVEADSRLPH